MNGLKQRIIGALVLVSLAVIFVPMMFDEPHSERQSRSIEIPEEPPFPEVEMPEQAESVPPEYRMEEGAPEASEPATEVERPIADIPEPEPAETNPPETSLPQTEPIPEAPEVEAEPIVAPEAIPEPESSPADSSSTAEFSQSLEGAWVVQLGSFGSDENAKGLREKVRDKGYSSHLQRVSQSGSTFTRVFSGPFAEKGEAEKAKQVLDKAFGLNSLVTSGSK